MAGRVSARASAPSKRISRSRSYGLARAWLPGAILLALLLVGCTEGGDALGERIYHEGSGLNGRVPYRAGPAWLAHVRLGCAACHGNAGEGRLVRAGQVAGAAPALTPAVLAARGYTPATLRRAIAEGVDPDGRVLGHYMPRWTLDAHEMKALLQHLSDL